MDSKLAPIDLGLFLAQPANMLVFGFIALFLFAVVLRASKETALVAVAAGAIGLLLTSTA